MQGYMGQRELDGTGLRARLLGNTGMWVEAEGEGWDG